ncbi:regulating synaptic membrane exocytosis protein 1-like [Actinia tenebrosa]|uniref:Regulating synaptic membrane exocytosis protein 1-like n=1 Tax=Actinia tenebrosa TaxID=6105 RepID=A0A6P8IR62_ACTTE|nr:regulating synaptic membrane exocytosis protein 1-like [Actinia tenebrosa]
METALQHVDFSSLSQEEATALQNVLLRQKEFEELNGIRRKDLRLELIQLEERLALAEKSATDKQLCQICFKTKVADGLRLNCRFCSRKTCTRCGHTELGRTSWMCQLCSKKRHCLTCTGDWYVGNEPLSANAQFFLDKLGESSTARMSRSSVREPTIPRFSTNNDIREILQSTSSRGTSIGDTQDTYSYSVCNEPEYLSLPVHEPRRRGLSEFSTESEFTSCFSVSTYSDGGMPALNLVEPTDSECDSSDSSGKNETIGRRKKKRAEESRDSKGRPMIERLTLSRETTSQRLMSRDTAFGVHIVGGKTSIGGIMGAFVVGVIPGTKAQELLCIGDQVIEWNNISLVDATFEGTHEAVASSSDEVSIVVCHVSKTDHQSPRPSCSQIVSDAIEKTRASFAREARSCNSQEELLQLIRSRSHNVVADSISCSNSLGVEANASETMNFWSHSSGNDRRSGLKISLWYDPGGLNLITKIIEARRLPLGTTPGDELPNPYAVVNLLPIRDVSTQFRTGVKFQTQCPVWNLTFIYSNITEEELSSRSLEVTLWSERKTRRHRFLGKIKVDLNGSVLSNIPQWYYLEDYFALFDEICIPVNRRYTLSSGEDVTKLYVGIDEMRKQFELTYKPRRAASYILRSYQSRRTIAGELESDFSEGFGKRRKTNSILSRNRAESCSLNRLLSYTTPKGKNTRSRYGSESLSRFGNNYTSRNLVVPSISSAPTTPCFGAFDKSPSFDYPSLARAFDYSYNYVTASKDERSPLSASSGSSQACNNQGQSLEFKFEEIHKDEEDGGHKENKKEEYVVQTEIDKKELKPEIDKPAYGAKQKLVQNISLNLHESSNNKSDKRERKLSTRTRRLSSQERSHSTSDSFMFDEDPEHGTIGPSQIRCHDNQDTYVKTYLIYNEKKLMKRKSSTVRQDLSPVYNCKVKYAARDVDSKILNVCVWQNQGLFGRNVPIGEVHTSLDRLNVSCRFVAWYKLFPLPNIS